jgi:hypothetical protein
MYVMYVMYVPLSGEQGPALPVVLDVLLHQAQQLGEDAAQRPHVHCGGVRLRQNHLYAYVYV